MVLGSWPQNRLMLVFWGGYSHKSEFFLIGSVLHRCSDSGGEQRQQTAAVNRLPLLSDYPQSPALPRQSRLDERTNASFEAPHRCSALAVKHLTATEELGGRKWSSESRWLITGAQLGALHVFPFGTEAAGSQPFPHIPSLRC